MPGFLIPAIIAGVSAVASGIQARRQRKANRELAAFQASANEKYLAEQNRYNSPAAQMNRFAEAGLNPNLIYSQGSAGNQSQALSYPQQDAGPYADYSDVGSKFVNAQLAQSQMQAAEVRNEQVKAQTGVAQLQQQLIAANPLLDTEGFRATIDGLKAAAQLKEYDSQLRGSQVTVQKVTEGMQSAKIFREVQLLEQKFKLGSLDAVVKAQVVESKEFQNEILRIQRDFMKSGDISAGHIYQFIQMLLLKLIK